MIATWKNGGAAAVEVVYLDGNIMLDVIHADDDKGEVTRHTRDENGKLKVVGKEFATVTDTGRVEIKLREGYRYDTRAERFIKLPSHLMH